MRYNPEHHTCTYIIYICGSTVTKYIYAAAAQSCCSLEIFLSLNTYCTVIHAGITWFIIIINDEHIQYGNLIKYGLCLKQLYLAGPHHKNAAYRYLQLYMINMKHPKRGISSTVTSLANNTCPCNRICPQCDQILPLWLPISNEKTGKSAHFHSGKVRRHDMNMSKM